MDDQLSTEATIIKQLDVWAAATVAGQTDAAVEAAQVLDPLLRADVVLP